MNVIGRLVALETSQADLLEQVCAGQTISADELRAAGTFTMPATLLPTAGVQDSRAQASLLD